MSQQSVQLKIKGLYTLQNQLGSVPPGSLTEATNVVINRDDIAEPRRGFKIYGNAMGVGSDDVAKQLFTYKNRLLRHYGSTLQYDSTGTGTFTSFSGSFTETQSGLRIKGIEANGNFFFTTDAGIKKISSKTAAGLLTATVTSAGGIKALDAEAVLNSDPGFLTQDSKVAYRIVWGITDANDNLILGTPSERIIVTNGITGLLTSDFNHLLTSLDTVNNPGGINNQDYLDTYKVPKNSSASELKTNLIALGTAIDGDTVITESTIDSATREKTGGVATIVFNTTIDTFLQVGDRVRISGLGGTNYNGDFYIESLPTTSSITYKINDSAVEAPTADTGGVVERLKYSIAPFRIVADGSAGSTVAGVAILTNQLYVRFDSSISSNLSVGDSVTLSGFENTISYVNGTYDIKSISSISTTNDTIGLFLVKANLAEVTSSDATNGSVAVNASQYSLTLSDNPTTNQLTQLQSYYDAIVTDLQLEPTGIVTDPSVFDNDLSTQSATVNVSFTVPQGVTTAHFYQIYRTQNATSTGVTSLNDLDPGDEQQLAIEENPTSADISAGTITVHDVTPSAFLGANLYTNPNSGEGILQANEPPPLARDIALYKDFTFYANTKTKYKQNISLLSVSELVDGVSTFTISNGSVTTTYTFVTGTAEVTTVTTVADVADSLNGKYFTLNAARDLTEYYFWYKTSGGSTSDPSISGKTGIRIDIATGASANTVASTTNEAINAIIDFDSTVLTNTITVTNSEKGVATDGTAATSGFTVTVTIQGTGEDSATQSVIISEQSTASQQVDETARSLVRVINEQTSGTVYAFYLSGPNDIPGMILLESRTLNDIPFYVLVNNETTASQFDPNLSPSHLITNISVANPTVITSVAHGLVSGNQIMISGSNSTPSVDGIYTITRIDNDTFTIPVNVTISGNRGGFILLTNAQKADNEVKPNRIYFSKFQQPEAVPIVNFLDVGPKDKNIQRIVALRDSLFILKDEGIYRLTGYASPFTVALFDSSTLIKAPDSAVVLNNLIYIFTNQGAATVSETGVSVISRSIENLLFPLLTSAYTTTGTVTFGVSYETDRSYYLFLPTTTEDDVATQCFRYNTFTNSWTKFDISKTCGLVKFDDDFLYLGAADINYIEQERKQFVRQDHADRQYDFTIDEGNINGTTISPNTITNIEADDVLLQTQYLTIAQFNRVLLKLDNDAGVSDNDYFSTLEAVAGNDLRTKLTALAVKLDNDPGVNDTDYAASIFAFGSAFIDCQDAFNVIVDKLNLDLGVTGNNYLTSEGTVEQEVIITSVDVNHDMFTIQYAYPLIAGTFTTFKRIPTTIVWASQYMGDPSILKQVSEATLLFERNTFNNATISYGSDLNPGFTALTFTGQGNGSFGNNIFGEGNFGGLGNQSPFRTYVPTEAQRCRYINCKYEHDTAREIFSIYGISLTFVPTSTRGYR